MGEGEQREEESESRLLLWNLLLTQLLITVLAVLLLWFQDRLTWELWVPAGWSMWGLGIAAGLAVVGLDRFLYRRVSKDRLDDGGLNRRLFQNLSFAEIAGIAAGVAVAEELLFRGAIQHWLGVIGTSLLFTLIHFRYLKQWILVTVLFGVGSLLGGLTESTGSLVPAVVAHFTVDFVLGLWIRFAEDP